MTGTGLFVAEGETGIAVLWHLDHPIVENEKDYTIHKLILYLNLKVA